MPFTHIFGGSLHIFGGHARPPPSWSQKSPWDPSGGLRTQGMGPPGHVTDGGDGPSGACFFLFLGRVGSDPGEPLGTLEALENPLGPCGGLGEPLGTLCVALCNTKVRTLVR